jgi:hypothetical protein
VEDERPERPLGALPSVIVFLALLAFGAWAVHRDLTFDGDVASYMAVVSRHGPALDDAVAAVDGCGSSIGSCTRALSDLRAVASSYEDDLGNHPAPCDDQANRDLWFALNLYLDDVARARDQLAGLHQPFRGLPGDLLANASAAESRANGALTGAGVCHDVAQGSDAAG